MTSHETPPDNRLAQPPLASSTDKVVIRNAAPGDFEAICALNLAEVQHTSAMDLARLGVLDALSCYHKVACLSGVVAGFLLAMCDESPYQNDNFEWFAKKYARFIYVDRVVISPAARGRRLGTLLYEDVFHHARSNAIPLVTCEYNIVPPNEPSRLFHDKFGFKEQGSHWVANGSKRVSLQVADAGWTGGGQR
jgi:predicted GNAT superfamily acetyltransferase